VPKVSAQHVSARRQQILDAARRCFAREGFHRTSMQHILGAAQLSAGAVYLYFRSKDEIIEALAEQRHARERELLRARREELPAVEALARIAEQLFGALARPEEREERRLGIQVWAEALRNRRIHALVRRGVDEPRKLLVALLERARERGELAEGVDLDAAARVMIALFHGFVLQQAWDPKLRSEPYREVVDVLLRALLVPARPRRDGVR
jgi:AcrR family transcriptional regulator